MTEEERKVLEISNGASRGGQGQGGYRHPTPNGFPRKSDGKGERGYWIKKLESSIIGVGAVKSKLAVERQLREQ